MNRSLFKSLFAFTIVTLISVGLQSPSAHAVSEKQYSEQMGALVWPFYGSGSDGSFKGKGGFTIKYRKWENPKEIGAVVVFPGRGDPFFDFAETIYDLASHGYSIYTLDHRGQASSDRLLANPQLGYVESFDDYVDDAKTFYDGVVKAKPHRKTFLLGHSMGGAVGAIYASRYPSDFDAVVLAAPMFEINTAPYSSWEARFLVCWNTFIGKGEEYGPTQHDYDTGWTFEGNHLTSSSIRWQTIHDLFATYPVLQIGGATNHWIDESLKAGIRIHDFADDFEDPLLMISAADDVLVEQPDVDYFCQHAKHCTQVPPYAGAMHQILSERDVIRDDVIAKIIAFYGQF